ncbi:MAG: sensor domain-containing diguanylate cyclase [Candidatus Omnitrophica bacterium]|nr:sensor domain-containing diguanylate cyclase [Candidatus Omnitrophota bacterium]
MYSSLLVGIFLYFLWKSHQREDSCVLALEKIQEERNVLEDKYAHARKHSISLQERIRRYKSLKIIIEEINHSLSLESAAEQLVSIVFSLIADNKGVAILYLINPLTRSSLSIVKSKKEDRKMVIKAKEGDAFDLWVLRHASPLLIEDVKKDFRFDAQKVTSVDVRPIVSLVASPLVIDNKIIGIVRLDHHESGVFSQDDLRFLVAISDIGAVALENGILFEKTQDLAIHDELTSLFTKRYSLNRLHEELQRSQRGHRPCALIMFDIDFFKQYNDSFGHSAGDLVLKSIAHDIVSVLQKWHPVVGRFGGEEFCAILPEVAKEEATLAAQLVQKKIESTKILLRRQETSLTISAGVAVFPDDAVDAMELIARADQALYKAKEQGRNRVVVFRSEG